MGISFDEVKTIFRESIDDSANINELFQSVANIIYQKGIEDAKQMKKHEDQKVGHWTTKRTLQHDGEWYCDRCDYEPIVFENTQFCPNCGAKMIGT